MEAKNAPILTIPATHNLWIAGGVIVFHLVMLAALPQFLLPVSKWWALLIPLFIWVHNTHWALIHEAVHRLFSPSPERNEWMGRVLSILMGTSFHVLRFGHLMHHQYNRQWESELYDGTRRMRKTVGYYCNLLGGLYFTEVVITLLAALLPEPLIKHTIQGPLRRNFSPAADAAEQMFLRRRKITQVRQDGMAVILLYGAVFLIYGPYWPWLLAFIFSRALAISFFDNIYHYGTAPDNSEAAAELAMPRILSAMLLHGNYHETHHYTPNIPWLLLPAHQEKPFGASILAGARRQLGGPIIVS